MLGFGTGKEILRVIVVSIMSAIILWILGSVVNAILPSLGAVVGILFVAIVALLLFFWSKALHPSEEIGIIEFIPVFIILGVLWALGLPQIEIAGTTAIGIKFAMLLSSVFLADTIYRTYLMK